MNSFVIIQQHEFATRGEEEKKFLSIKAGLSSVLKKKRQKKVTNEVATIYIYFLVGTTWMHTNSHTSRLHHTPYFSGTTLVPGG